MKAYKHQQSFYNWTFLAVPVPYLRSRLLRLDPEEPVAVFRRPVDVAERPAVRQVLGDEADLVHRMVIQTILER